jgi:tetratricopeptide (TPR) repeat protein
MPLLRSSSRNVLILLFLSLPITIPVWAQDAFQPTLQRSMVNRFQNAQAFRKSGQATQSIKALKAIVAQSPDYFLAWYNLGLAYTAVNDFVNGAAALDKAIEVQLKLLASNQIKPEFTVYNTAGWAHMQLNQLDAADRYFKVAISNLKQLPSEDSQGRVLNNCGLLRIRQNNYAEAKTFFEQSLALGNPMAKANLSYLARLQKLKKAAKTS